MASLGLARSAPGTVDGWGHVVQSLTDILATMVGTCVLRRDYGSILPRLVDEPMDDEGVLRIVMATAVAIAMWEPRIDVRQVLVTQASPGGRVGIRLVVDYYPRGHLGDRSQVSRIDDIDIVV